MAGKSAVLAIRIIADGKQAGREFAETNKQVASFDDGLRKASVGAGIAIAGIAGLAIAAGNAASELQQATGGIESVYGAHADEVKKMADSAAENVGLAKSQYMQLSSVIGSQLKSLGTPMKDVAGQTGDLVSLGADLAATYGGTTADAVAALSSLLRGERNPIERYGVSINEAAVKAQALSMGLATVSKDAGKVSAAQARAEVAQRKYNDAIKKHGADSTQALSANASLISAQSSLDTALEGTTAELTMQQKAQATLALLADQTSAAQGQFARETDTAAGAQQIATAKWEDAQAVLGEQLLPIMAELAGMLSDVAGWVSENTELVTGIAVAIGIFAGAILIANGAISAYRTIAAIATAAQIAWNIAMTANPLGIIITTIGLIIAAIVLLTTNWEEVGRIAGEVWDNIVHAIENAIGWIKDAIGWIGSLFGAADGASKHTSTGGGGGPEIAPQVMTMSAQSIAPASSSLGGGGGWSAWAASSGATVREGDTNITVNGAIDTDGTARTIENVMNKRKARTGRTPEFAGGDSQWR